MNLKTEEIKEIDCISTEKIITSVTETISKNDFQSEVLFRMNPCHTNRTYSCIDQLTTDVSLISALVLLIIYYLVQIW